MRNTGALLRAFRVPTPQVVAPRYSAPSLSAITSEELPNNSFERNDQYHIPKTSFGHWPVYKKVQNTKISTEIKRVEGNVQKFAQELSSSLKGGNIPEKHITVNTLTGEVNIKGDYVSKIRAILDKNVKLA